jgi:hypothetical protein
MANNNFRVKNGLTVDDLATIGSTTDATDKTTGGALTVSGGAAISKKLFVGTSIGLPGSSSGTITLIATAVAGTNTITLPAATGNIVTTGDNGTVTSTMIADGTIVNGDINASAAIAYSKLSLTTSIVNGDISTSAAIAYSKLSLTTSIVNGDISTSAAIAITKLAASTISGISLGSNLNALTISTGLSGTSYNGGSAVTIAIDNTVALKADTHYIGTTSIALNRTSAAQSLTGITSIDGYAAGLAGGNATTLLGSLPYQSAANTTTLLSPNTTVNRKFLTQTGNGTNGAAPVWSQTFTTSATAPGTPIVGDFWYKSGTDILYQYVNDGGTSFWLSLNTYPSSYSNFSVTSALTVAGSVSSNLVPSVNNSYNLGSASYYWANIYGTSSYAKYADLAEKYTSDIEIIPGQVVVFGGDKEVTLTDEYADTRIAGVVSTDPGFLMNSKLEDGYPIAMTGRVPCFVMGPISKGDIVTSSKIKGVATKLQKGNFIPGCIIGKSLEEHLDETVKVIEVVVGRF